MNATIVSLASADRDLRTFVAEHNADVWEADFPAGFHGWFATVHGRLTLLFPTGSDPAIRLQLARDYVKRLPRASRSEAG